MKAQTIRLLDVVAIGPLMVWSARYLPTTTTQAVMVFVGLATVVYNGANYLRGQRGN